MLNLILTACCLTAAAPAVELSWAELVHRPELWPAQCTARQAMNFPGGVSVQAGQKLNVITFKANGVEVGTADGRAVFAATPDETDALAVARAAYEALTPKQRELTYGLLAQRSDLWPRHVVLASTLDLGGGKALRQGDQLRVLGFTHGALSLLAESLNTIFNFAPQATDFMAQARKFVEDEKAGPRYSAFEQNVPARPVPEVSIIGELEGKLVNAVTNRPEPLDANALPRYLVFYRGSSTCPFTRGFTPTLVKYYSEMKPKHPEFEVIYLTTEPAAATGKFAKKMGFSWRAVAADSTAAMPDVARAIGPLLPQLIVMDRSGHILINGMQQDAMSVLRRFDTLLNQPPAPN